jgi:hypothetical protein
MQIELLKKLKEENEGMKKRVALFICLLMFGLLSMSIANAEQAKTPSPVLSITEAGQMDNGRIDPEQWLSDTGAVLTSPKHWDSANWNRFALYGGLTYLIYENDDHIQDWFQEGRSKKTNKIADVGNSFPTAGAVYLTGTYFLGNERQRQVAVTGLESMGIALLTTEVLTLAAHRDRPNGDDRSFPSSHTAAAFALATVIADEYRDDDKTVPYLAYGLATLTAYSRLNDNRHWGSDVVAGALIGYYTAKTVGRINNSRNFQLQPYVSSDKRGVVLSKQF